MANDFQVLPPWRLHESLGLAIESSLFFATLGHATYRSFGPKVETLEAKKTADWKISSGHEEEI